MRQRNITILLAVALVVTGALCWQQHRRALENERELVSTLRISMLNAMTDFRHAASSGDPTERTLLKLSALSYANQAASIILYLDRGPERDAQWLDAISNLTMGNVINTALNFGHKTPETDARLQGQADLLQSFLPQLEEVGKLPNAYPRHPIAGNIRLVRKSLFRRRLREFIEQNELRTGPKFLGVMAVAAV